MMRTLPFVTWACVTAELVADQPAFDRAVDWMFADVVEAMGGIQPTVQRVDVVDTPAKAERQGIPWDPAEVRVRIAGIASAKIDIYHR